MGKAVGEADLLECHSGRLAKFPISLKFQGDAYVFEGRQIAHEVVLLEDDAQVFRAKLAQLVLAELGQVIAFYLDRARIRMVKPGKQREKGGFSTPALSKNGDDFPWLDREIEAVENLDSMITLMKGFGYLLKA